MNEGGDKSPMGDVSKEQTQNMDQTPPKVDNGQRQTQYQETYPMRSTAVDTGAFRSQYAQQRERESSGQYYRETQARDTFVGSFPRDGSFPREQIYQ
jgi:hypothetical protein